MHGRMQLDFPHLTVVTLLVIGTVAACNEPDRGGDPMDPIPHDTAMTGKRPSDTDGSDGGDTTPPDITSNGDEAPPPDVGFGDESTSTSGSDTSTGGEGCAFLIENWIAFGEYEPDVYLIFISPSWADSWGPDQLGGEVLGYGQGIRFIGVPPDTYDMQAVDEDGDTYTLWGVDCYGEEAYWPIASTDLD